MSKDLQPVDDPVKTHTTSWAVMHCPDSYHTLKKDPSGVYDSVTLEEIIKMMSSPTMVSKNMASFFIPSTYVAFDARAHAAQRRHGQFVMLTIDLDKGGHQIDPLIDAIEACVGACLTLIYSSSGSTAEKPKWRAILPLSTALSGVEFSAYQTALYGMLEERGFECDPTLARHGQAVYLPNVKPELCVDGQPLFYDHAVLEGDLLDPRVGELHERAQAILAEASARMAVVREVSSSRTVGGAIGWFEKNFSVEDMLAQYGYEQKTDTLGIPTDDWKSPFSSGYSTRNYGDHWISLSYTDAEKGIGRAKGTSGAEDKIDKHKYRFGGAFDLLVFYEFGGDAAAAMQAVQALMDEESAEKKAKLGAGVAKLAEKTQTALPAPVSQSKGAPLDHDDLTPFSFDQWVYLQNVNRFFNMIDQRCITPQAFDKSFNRHTPVKYGPKGAIIRTPASEYHTIDLDGGVAFDSMYLPGEAPTFRHSGLDWVNSYNPLSVPEPSSRDDAGKAVERHLQSILPEDWEIIVRWMATIVQDPSARFRWGMLIKGIEGDGKTLIARAMSAAIGAVNVRVVGPDATFSRFNGYAEGSRLVYLEELRAVGHSRYDVENRLKPLITNDMVEIERKGLDSKTVQNVSSYLALTNYEDALPLTDGDRRYYVAITRMNSREELKAEMPEAYFNTLFDGIRDYPGEIRKWLLDVDTAGLSLNTLPAFQGSGKARMILNARADDEVDIQNIIDDESIPTVGREVILSATLSNKLKDAGVTLRTKALANRLNHMGYVNLGRVITISGAAARVYIKRGSPILKMPEAEGNQAIRDALKRSEEGLGEKLKNRVVVPFSREE